MQKDINIMAKSLKKNLEPELVIEKTEKEFNENITSAGTYSTDEQSVEYKLVTLYKLQQIDSQIDNIRVVRGELPLEVQDLEDNCAGLETRIAKFTEENNELEKNIQEKNLGIKDAKALIKKYEDQQNNVRNNREYEALSKEIEFKQLEIQLFEKRIKECTSDLIVKKEELDLANTSYTDVKNELEIKRAELDDIIAETEKDEQDLEHKSKEQQEHIESRLLIAYKRIRKSSRNGLAVVKVERNACGGCFNKIPPQRHLDIKMHKKIIVCEYCGRVLIDEDLADKI